MIQRQRNCVPLLDREKTCRRGSVLPFAAAVLIVVFVAVSFCVDLGYIMVARNDLQTSADAAAYAGIIALGNGNSEGQGKARNAAVELAESNSPGHGAVLKSSDVAFGIWDSDTETFIPNSTEPNAIKVLLRRSNLNGNPLSLFFAPVLGHSYANISATAIATAPGGGGGPDFRFLIDDEMFDSDEPSIEDEAVNLGVSPDDLISDGNGDGFIDIPSGTTLELPTGQVGDEGLFDRSTFEGAFPFTDSSPYTTLDFLAEGTALQDDLGTQSLQDVQWNSSNAPHPELNGKKVLDPVPGCDPMDSHADILALPDPDTILLSPVYKSDVSMAETDPSKYGSPAANCLGERRGLVAFKILSARSHPAGGSYLPLITIQIIDPATIDFSEVTLDGGAGGGSGSARLVQ